MRVTELVKSQSDDWENADLSDERSQPSPGLKSTLLLRETAAFRIQENQPATLTTAELLSVVTGAETTKSLALLERFDGSLRSMRSSFTPSVADPRYQLTRSQAVRLVAALELGRRQETEGRPLARVKLRGPRDVSDYCHWMEELMVEEFHILALNSQHQVVKDVLISRGILNSSLVHPREVFAEAIRYRSAAIVLVHNHPSGDPTPSPDDRIVTDQLIQAGRLLDIPVHDHVVIGGSGSYTSFAEAGLL